MIGKVFARTAIHQTAPAGTFLFQEARYPMHEMGVAMQIVEIATASIPGHLPGARVAKVNLKVGKLSAIVPDSLTFCFDVVAKDTPLEGAHLDITEIPVQAVCNACRNEWTIDQPAFSCPACNSGDITLLTGRELDIESIELAEEE
jgi:hydrogenase nickel incorporation protein HypA/HybF